MELAIITMEALHDLEQGKQYTVKVRDIDGVRHESRGKEVEFIFRDISPREHDLSDGPIPHGGFTDNPNDWMVNGNGVGDDDEIVYGFHAWLIEEITPS